MPLMDLGHINQITIGPVVALMDLGHLNQTSTRSVVSMINVDHIKQITIGPVVACHLNNTAFIARPVLHPHKPFAMPAINQLDTKVGPQLSDSGLSSSLN